jgi:hypothetical protein
LIKNGCKGFKGAGVLEVVEDLTEMLIEPSTR